MDTYFNILPKELIYEIGYYLSPEDIYQVSEMVLSRVLFGSDRKKHKYFDEYYFWENYLIHRNYLFLKLHYNITSIRGYTDWVDSYILINEEAIEDITKLIDSKIFYYYGDPIFINSSIVNRVPNQILINLRLPELSNLNGLHYDVIIKYNIINQLHHLQIFVSEDKVLEVQVSKDDVFKLIIYYKIYKLYKIYNK